MLFHQSIDRTIIADQPYHGLECRPRIVIATP